MTSEEVNDLWRWWKNVNSIGSRLTLRFCKCAQQQAHAKPVQKIDDVHR